MPSTASRSTNKPRKRATMCWSRRMPLPLQRFESCCWKNSRRPIIRCGDIDVTYRTSDTAEIVATLVSQSIKPEELDAVFAGPAGEPGVRHAPWQTRALESSEFALLKVFGDGDRGSRLSSLRKQGP